MTVEEKKRKRAEYMAKWRAANKERCKEQTRQWQASNPERVKLYRRKTYEKHRESRIARVNAFGQTQRGKEIKRRSRQAWENRNPDAVEWLHAKHLLSKSSGLPPALIPSELIEAKIRHLRLMRAVKAQRNA